MSMGDTLDYITLRNPISKMVISSGSAVLRSIGLRPKDVSVINGNGKTVVSVPKVPNAAIMNIKLSGLMPRGHYNFIRLAGISGAWAILMGVYCKYHLRLIEDPKKQMDAQVLCDVANRMHFLHSFMLIAVPLVHYPIMTGSLITIGTALFSGSMYYRALANNSTYQHVTTFGGIMLIAGWLSIIF